MSTFYFVIVGPGDRPLYEAELGLILNASATSAAVSPATGTISQQQQQQQQQQQSSSSSRPSKHLSQFIVHSALDVVDEAVWASSQPYLRAVDRFNDQLVSAYVTPGNIRLLLVHSAPSSEGSSSSAARTEESIRLFFTDVHDIYVKAQMNPFFSTGTSIKSPAFDAKSLHGLARHRDYDYDCFLSLTTAWNTLYAFTAMDSFVQFSNRLDLGQLLSIQVGIALLSSFGHHPFYNLPIMLFGWWAHAQEGMPEQLKRFILLLSLTGVFDVMWFIHHVDHGFTFQKLMTGLNLIIKPVTIVNAIQSLQTRGIALDEDGAVGGFASRFEAGFGAATAAAAAGFGAATAAGGYSTVPSHEDARQISVVTSSPPPPPEHFIDDEDLEE